jgi:hypothetical protein
LGKKAQAEGRGGFVAEGRVIKLRPTFQTQSILRMLAGAKQHAWHRLTLGVPCAGNSLSASASALPLLAQTGSLLFFQPLWRFSAVLIHRPPAAPPNALKQKMSRSMASVFRKNWWGSIRRIQVSNATDFRVFSPADLG